MNHLIQVARRTNKTATGFKVQLVVHRMTAHLPASYDGVELCAVISRHKKRMTTKCACYQAAKHEVVWGDILPFATTLYLAKTGLYQAKVFQVHIFDTRTDHQLATFEFNLAELVQSAKDSTKESIMVPAVKGQDPRASLSLTAITVKATSAAAAQFSTQQDGSNAEEMSFSGSQSDMSVITLESKSSRASMSRAGRSMVTSPTGADSKSDVLRGAYPAGDGNDAVELYNLRSKHQELMRSVQELEEQLRQSESENVKMNKKLSDKDAVIAKLHGEKQELDEQLQQLQQQLQQQQKRPASEASESESESGDNARMAQLMEENDALRQELSEWKEKLRALEAERSSFSALPPIPVTVNRVEQNAGVESDNSSDSEEEEEQEEEQEKREERRSEAASSANEYVDAHDSQLLGEIADLKHTLKTMMTERFTQQATVSELTTLKDQLTSQVHSLEAKLAALQATISSLEQENASQRLRLDEQTTRLRDVAAYDEEQEERSRTASMEAQRQNEKLVEQLSHLDNLVTKLTGEKEALARKLQQAESSQDEAQREMAQAQEAIGKLAGSNSEIHEQLESAQQANDRARHEIETAQLTIDELRDQLRELSERLQSTQVELETLRDGELAASAAAAAAAIAKNQELQGRWDDLKLQNEQLQSRVDELEQRLADTEASGEEREAELQQQVEELKRETAQLREELAVLRASKQQAEDELHDRASELKQVLENQQRLTSDHAQSLGEMHMEKEDAQSRVAEKALEKEAVEAAMKKRLAELEQENDYFQGELIDSKMKLAELTARNEELSSQYHRVEKSLNELKAKAAEPVPAGKKK